MPRFSLANVREGVKSMRGAGRNPRAAARIVLGVLVAANLVAAAVVWKPWAGSAGDLEKQAAGLRQSLRQQQAALDKLHGMVGKVQTARTDGDGFMESYLLSRRSVSSNLLDDLDQMARKAALKQKEVTFGFEPIEGSDTLTKTTITAAYEGAYGDLVRFLNLLDHSPRLLIVESLAATPEPSGPSLSITMKLSAFVREGGAPPAIQAAAGAPEGPTQ
jgi:type IV pilus assembly protein PilO